MFVAGRGSIIHVVQEEAELTRQRDKRHLWKELAQVFRNINSRRKIIWRCAHAKETCEPIALHESDQTRWLKRISMYFHIFFCVIVPVKNDAALLMTHRPLTDDYGAKGIAKQACIYQQIRWKERQCTMRQWNKTRKKFWKANKSTNDGKSVWVQVLRVVDECFRRVEQSNSISCANVTLLWHSRSILVLKFLPFLYTRQTTAVVFAATWNSTRNREIWEGSLQASGDSVFYDELTFTTLQLRNFTVATAPRPTTGFHCVSRT